jgi:hypothetical protein
LDLIKYHNPSFLNIVLDAISCHALICISSIELSKVITLIALM